MTDKQHYAFPHVIPDAKTDYITRKMYDLAYASVSPAQKLDVYWPSEGNGPFPVIIAIHGGAFMGGDKRDAQLTPMLEGLKRGYAVVSVNYRMSGEAIFPALIHDLKAAIRWIRANAESFLFDPNRIATWGGSAGGYLSLMAGVSSGVIELTSPELGNTDYTDNANAVVAWFPPTNFATMDIELAYSGINIPVEFSHSADNSPESLLLGNKITNIPELVKMANPATYIHPGTPKFFIQHGTHDSTVPYQQSMNFATKLDAISPHTVTYELLLNAEHADPAFGNPRNIHKVLDFLDSAFQL
jgi:Esterase/lipase